MATDAEKPVYIYGLADPRDGLIKYIGKSFDPKHRLSDHQCSTKQERGYLLQRWLREIAFAPVLTILEECTNNWRVRERFWIAKLRLQLVNLRPGGESGVGATVDIENNRRCRISRARTGMRFSLAHRQRLSQKKKEYFSDVRNTFNLSRRWAKLSDEQVIEIRHQAADGVKQAVLVNNFHIPSSTVSEIVNGIRYKHVPMEASCQNR